MTEPAKQTAPPAAPPEKSQPPNTPPRPPAEQPPQENPLLVTPTPGLDLTKSLFPLNTSR